MIHLETGVVVSAIATAVAAALAVLAVRRLAEVLMRGPAVAATVKRVPAWAAGWIGLAAFAAGVGLGRAFWP